MATIRRRNGRYHVQIRRKGFSPITSTFSRLTIARRWIASIEADIESKVHIDYSEAEKTTLNDLLNRYESEVLPSKKGGKVEHYRIGTLKQHLGHGLLSDLSPARIGAYRDIRLKSISPASLKRELVILSRVLTVASKDWGIALPFGNCVQETSLPQSDHARTRRLEKGEEQKLLTTTNDKLRRIIILALETAMRRGEILNIKKSHINFTKSILFIPSTKTDRPRTIPLSNQSLTSLIAQLRASQSESGGVIPLHEPTVFDYQPRGLSGEFLKLCRRKGIENLHFHDLRHEATSRLFEKGLNPVEVATITGHKDTRMLMRYTHLRAEDLVKRLG